MGGEKGRGQEREEEETRREEKGTILLWLSTSSAVHLRHPPSDGSVENHSAVQFVANV